MSLLSQRIEVWERILSISEFILSGECPSEDIFDRCESVPFVESVDSDTVSTVLEFDGSYREDSLSFVVLDKDWRERENETLDCIDFEFGYREQKKGENNF